MRNIFKTIKGLFDSKTAYENTLEKMREKFILANDIYTLALMGDVNSVKLLLEKGFNINKQNEKGNTLAHLAIVFNQPIILQLCIDMNANLNITNDDGQTALELLSNKISTSEPMEPEKNKGLS